MFETPGLYLNTRVYAIRRRKNNLDEILAYRIHQEKGFISYTFQTRREIPEVLEIYKKIGMYNDNDYDNEYYPAAFILPPPSPKMHGQPIPFDGYFALVIGYAKEIPPYVPLNNLIYAFYIEIMGEDENKLSEMHVNGISGLDFLQDHKEPRKYILYLENVTNSADLISFIIYNSIYSNSKSTEKNKMVKAGWFIVIDDDTSKNHIFTPTNIKILEIFK